MRVTVCWKWVSVDGGEPDERWAGVSAADEAALEIGLRLAADGAADATADGVADAATAQADGGAARVTVVCVGPTGADTVLRDALAAGADRAVRIDSTDASSREVASAIAAAAADSDVVVCGDYSLDRGTGSVPAFVAAYLGAAQALGLVDVDTTHAPLRAVRRLDGGRREVLDVPLPAVISVEGSVARLRRASLAAALRSKTDPIAVVPGPTGHMAEATVSAYRPRARNLPAPSGNTLSRVRDILDIGSADANHAETVTLDPASAARRIVDQLDEWGQLT